jgi:acetolactate synthase-1/2/3 large subunit
VGIKGSRAGNFALQNADLLIILGSSLGASVIGYDPKQFSPESFKIMIDIDQNEIDKNIIKIDHVYHTSLKKFFGDVL